MKWKMDLLPSDRQTPILMTMTMAMMMMMVNTFVLTQNLGIKSKKKNGKNIPIGCQHPNTCFKSVSISQIKMQLKFLSELVSCPLEFTNNESSHPNDFVNTMPSMCVYVCEWRWVICNVIVVRQQKSQTGVEDIFESYDVNWWGYYSTFNLRGNRGNLIKYNGIDWDNL